MSELIDDIISIIDNNQRGDDVFKQRLFCCNKLKIACLFYRDEPNYEAFRNWLINNIKIVCQQISYYTRLQLYALMLERMNMHYQYNYDMKSFTICKKYYIW
jgi:hypothetical protein